MTTEPDQKPDAKAAVSDARPPAAEDAGKADASDTKTVGQTADGDANAKAAPTPAFSAEPAKTVAEGGTPVEGSTLSEEELDQMTSNIVAALKTVYDPEIPADIYELGLIYRVEIDDDKHVTVDMTLTSPGCPVAGEMPGWVENAVATVPGASGAKVNLTFDPPWDPSRMSDEARLALNMF